MEEFKMKLRNCEDMKKLLEKAEKLIDDELEESSFIDDSDMVYRYLDDLAEGLSIDEIVGNDKSLESYYKKEDEICELTDKLLEMIHANIMKKYNVFESCKNGIYKRFFYKVDKKFETLEEFLDYFGIDF